ncbi:MAG: hypothetical protein M3O36_07230 [Myxococcota bacterium]|nr:hypothetical protein [Myxococcota bacterium]
MATPLRSQLDLLVASFADAVLDILRATPLDELVEGSAATRGRAPADPASAPAANPRSTGRLHRRSAEEIAAALSQIVALLNTHKGGLRAEDIRMSLGMQAKELPRILKQGLAENQLRSTGQKRATTYFASR